MRQHVSGASRPLSFVNKRSAGKDRPVKIDKANNRIFVAVGGALRKYKRTKCLYRKINLIVNL